jgi:hypothetical protein
VDELTRERFAPRPWRERRDVPGPPDAATVAARRRVLVGDDSPTGWEAWRHGRALAAARATERKLIDAIRRGVS